MAVNLKQKAKKARQMAYPREKQEIHKQSKMNAQSLVSLHGGLDGGSGIHCSLKNLAHYSSH